MKMTLHFNVRMKSNKCELSELENNFNPIDVSLGRCPRLIIDWCHHLTHSQEYLQIIKLQTRSCQVLINTRVYKQS